MKAFRRLVLLVSLWLFIGNLLATAQAREHVLKVGYGILPVQKVFYGFLKGAGTDITWKVSDGTGPVRAGYSFTLDERWEVGIDAAFTQLKQQGRNRPNDDSFSPPVDTVSVIAEERRQFYSLMPSLTFNIITLDKFRLYSSVAFGARYRVSREWREEEPDIRKNSNIFFAYQFNGLGISYGKRIKAYAEFGVGFHGVFNGGLCIAL